MQNSFYADPIAWEIKEELGRSWIRTPTSLEWQEIFAERIGSQEETPLLQLCVRIPSRSSALPLVTMLYDSPWYSPTAQTDLIRIAVSAARAAASPAGRRRAAALRAACRLFLPEPAHPGQTWWLIGNEIVDSDLDMTITTTNLEISQIADILVPPQADGCFWGAAVAGWLQGSVADDRPRSAHHRQRLRIEAAEILNPVP